MLAGILFSLVAHALSVILVGESLVLTGTKMFPSFMSFSIVPFLVVAVTAIATEAFYRTDLGIITRLVGSAPTPNTRISSDVLRWLGFCVTGVVIGTGSAIYAHQQGVARSGGSFEFLVVGLSSFLLVDRFIEIVSALAHRVGRRRPSAQNIKEGFRLYTLIHSVALKALLGSIIFQIAVLLILYTAPNPAYWKMIFGIALLLSVARPMTAIRRWSRAETNDLPCPGVDIRNLNVQYDLGYEQRTIFDSLSILFEPGINFIWGANGEGKSTLLRCIRGDIPTHLGQIIINGQDVTGLPRHGRKTFLLTQKPYDAIAYDLRVFENLIATQQQKKSVLRFSSPESVLNELNLKLKDVNFRKPSENDSSIWLQEAQSLSGGQAQRVAFYMAILADADVLLADEPSSGLDKDNLIRLATVLEGLAAVGKTLIIATHDNRMKSMPGRHFEIRSGRIYSRDEVVLEVKQTVG